MVNDLTQGAPLKQIVRFAIPLIFGMVLQQLYSVVDSVIVGKILGSDALAAVGTTGSVNFFVLGFCSGLCNGFAVLIAQQFGAKDEEELRRFFANGIWLCGVAAIFFTALTVILCDDIMWLLKTPENIFEDACMYIRIIFAGIPATLMYNMLSGTIRSLGDSKTPLLILAAASVVNIILDILFIAVLQMGVAGAGFATVIAQVLSGLACLMFMRIKFPILKVRKNEWHPRKNYIKRLCRIGIPAGLQSSVIAVGLMIIQTAINMLGTIYVAAISAAHRITSIFFILPSAFGTTTATYVGQNAGAGRLDRLKSGMKALLLIAVAEAVVSFVILHFFAPQLSLLFVNAEEKELIGYISQYLSVIGIFYFLTILANILMSAMLGMGYGGILIVSGFSEVIVRCVFSFVFIPVWGYTAVCFVDPTSWVIAVALLIPSYFYCVYRVKKCGCKIGENNFDKVGIAANTEL